MSGLALEPVQYQLTTSRLWGQAALDAAKTALDKLAALQLSTAYPTSFSTPSVSDAPVSSPSPPGALSIGSAPTVVTLEVPTKPTKPETTTPTLGTLQNIVMPNIPSLDSFPSLDITAPVYDITPPHQWNYNVGNVIITDDPMIQAAITRLTNNIANGGTGLSPAVETAIWDRDRERNEQQLSDSTDKVKAMWAKTGFSLPDGPLADSLMALQIEYMNKNLDRSREIAVKQAELEQSNLFKSLELTVTLADRLINMLIKYEELVFQAEEATAKFANEYIDLQIKTYMSKVEGYKATAQVREMIIRAEMTKVELYKAQIEGQKLVGEVNAQTIQIYSEQLRATTILIETYKTEVDAMIAELGVEKAKIEANKLQFDAWAKDADVRIAKYNGETEMFKANTQLNVVSAELKSKISESQAKMYIAASELGIKSIEITNRSNDLHANIMMEAARGVATATASMTAGAMAAMSAHASMSYSEAMSGSLDN
jgi:hypothetical protein